MGRTLVIKSVEVAGRTFDFDEKLEVEVEPYECPHCKEEITLEQIKKTIGGTISSKQEENINAVLPYLNKYREDFGLDTCLRKAHFVAQIILECARFKTFAEYESYRYTSVIPGVFSNDTITFDQTIANSLEDYLTDIIKIEDKEGNIIPKTNAQLKQLLLDEEVQVIDKKFYAKYDGGEELLKEVNGEEEIKFKIILKNHGVFGVPLLSRAYAPYSGDKRELGNGDELTRDGWKFKGRGLKQLTGRNHYSKFKDFRDSNPFPEDNTGEIDFTAENDKNDLTEGNYLKLSENSMYATQSALYFWNKGSVYKGKYPKDLAEEDDVEGVSKAVNYYDTGGLPMRVKYYKKARKSDVFNLKRHFQLIYENGNEEQKRSVKRLLEKWRGKYKETTELLKKINEEEIIELKPLGLKK
ncbi:hypothetical protein [Sinomicrobium weinanense]|uniref:Uncharacterized protein n=1 Tax=Sinomicrobium weinanense TaxID=2842200 RepID=A0A926JPW3_9FLAO|nr:hypothetical protein [Sinomicrobium weinanense]MBC9795268.1 hypothetical protein [Sinomicrobium weinanense]MBU3125740.1 hypothetical protein [Sinomicrobium weinanense]